MEINKSKCGIMFLSGQIDLPRKEKIRANIEGIPIVQHYKYLGIILNKMLSPSNHLTAFANKLAKFQQMSFILLAH